MSLAHLLRLVPCFNWKLCLKRRYFLYVINIYNDNIYCYSIRLPQYDHWTHCATRPRFVYFPSNFAKSSQWHGRSSASKHRNLILYLASSILFRQPPKNTWQSSALLTHCECNPPATDGFPSEGVSNLESVSMSQFHHAKLRTETSRKNTLEATCYWSMTSTPTLRHSLQRWVLDNWISRLCMDGMGFCYCRPNASSTVVSSTIHIKLFWFTPGIKTLFCYWYNMLDIIVPRICY